MGRITTKFVRNLAKKIFDDHISKFTDEDYQRFVDKAIKCGRDPIPFEVYKQVVKLVVPDLPKKVRNQVAGCLVRIVRRKEKEFVVLRRRRKRKRTS